ncbi:hypothetical protein AHiyo4_39240 [Arthrobacter sp. Hiyo4]|nr:hypothetical protein AHiyo4_39240 [Arthrobacter sp. Hiyo4]
MAPDDGNALPLLDPDVLDRLRTELEDDDGVWKVFVQNFIDNLPHRTEKLRLTLTTGDLAGAMDAVLSLKTSSQMVGAERLAGLAMELERALHHETLDSEPARVLPRLAADRLRQIVRCARQTTNILQKYVHAG